MPTKSSYLLQMQQKEELDHMEKAGVISKVTDPTLWCTGMVVVQKKGGAVSVCRPQET